MTTMTRIEQIWSEVRESAKHQPIAEGTYKLRRIDPQFRFDVFAGVDGSGYVLLAIGVGSTPPALKLESASLDYFRQKRNDGSWLMVLRLRQLALSGVFGRLCQDLVDAMESVSNEVDLIAFFRERLILWKKLFDKGSGSFLEPYQVKGLIAELLVLEDLIVSGHRPALEAVTGWVGPCGADQDFQFADLTIEVKAVGPGADSVSISSLQQLESLVPIRLAVHTLRPASADEPNAMGLNSIVPRVEGTLASSPGALLLYQSRLLEAGYVDDPHYDTFLFQPMAREQFIVSDTFPKLTTGNVPKGLVSATYNLSLTHLRNPS
jgi:hypothetical protein